ncbi:MAG: hypothetical protein WC788_09460 [Candidatus Paceibacterota bacterium]|jgi:uncharacterized protein YaiE (UPF0345 family)
MSELIDLSKAIMFAISKGQRCTIAVHSNNQFVFATAQASRMAANNNKPNLVTFRIVDFDDQKKYPVGEIISEE